MLPRPATAQPGETTPLAPPQAPIRLDYLEALRFIAAFNVTFLWHLAPTHSSCGHPNTEPWRYPELNPVTNFFVNIRANYLPTVMFMNGGYNVSIFFVLSAICLTAKTFTTGEDIHLKKHLDKRIIRLVPPCLFVVVVYELLAHVFPSVYAPNSPIWRKVWGRAGTEEGGIFTLFNDFSPLWTLLYEVPAPMYLWLMHTMDNRKIGVEKFVIACMFCLFPLFLSSWTYPFSLFGFGFYLSQSIFGVGGFEKLATAQGAQLPILWALVLLSHLASGFMVNAPCCFSHSWCQNWIAPSVVLLMTAICATPAVQWVFLATRIHHLGKYTFMMYISHVCTWTFFTPVSTKLRDAGYAYVGLVLVTLLTGLVTLLMYHLVDVPSIRAGDAYAKWCRKNLKR